MRDLMRDAAIITIAQHAMDEDSWMAVEVFLEVYSSNDRELADLRNDLVDLQLVFKTRKPKAWYDPEPAWAKELEYTWHWISEYKSNR